MDLELMLKLVPVFNIGALMTIELTILAVLFGTPIGLALAFMKISRNKAISGIARFYIYAVRGTPLLLQIFFIYYGMPAFGVVLSPFAGAAVGMSLNSAAYIAEIIRGGILSIDRGQVEAASSLGMTHMQTMFLVVLPQAFLRILPPMGNEFIALLKDSSLVSAIGMVDLMRSATHMYSTYFAPVESFTLAGIYYLIMTTFFTLLFGRLEKRLSVY